MRYEHDRAIAVLAPVFRWNRALPRVALWLVPLAPLAILALRQPRMGLLGVAWLLIGLVGLKRGSKSLQVSVDSRWVELSDGRTFSLLDLHHAWANPDGFLVLQTQPGPVLDAWIPCRQRQLHEVTELAAAINEAIARASHRGDGPDARTRAVEQLLTERT